MGYALAHAFAHAGHRVLLISGPTSLPLPDHVDYLPVTTAAEMYEAASRHIGRMDIAIFAAAVADYTPVSVEPRKIKKSGDSLTLELKRTQDILGSARSTLGFQGTLVGFAAETENLEANAREKLRSKQCDLVIANDVSKPGSGFDSDRNEVLLVYPDQTVPLPEDDKVHLANHLAEAILELAAGNSGR